MGLRYYKTKYNWNLRSSDENTSKENYTSFVPGPDSTTTLGMWPAGDNSYFPPFDRSEAVWGPEWGFNNPITGVPPGRPATTNNPLGPHTNPYTNNNDVKYIRTPTDLELKTTAAEKKSDTDITSMTESQYHRLLKQMEENQIITNNLFSLVLLLLFLIIVKLF